MFSKLKLRPVVFRVIWVTFLVLAIIHIHPGFRKKSKDFGSEQLKYIVNSLTSNSTNIEINSTDVETEHKLKWQPLIEEEDEQMSNWHVPASDPMPEHSTWLDPKPTTEKPNEDGSYMKLMWLLSKVTRLDYVKDEDIPPLVEITCRDEDLGLRVPNIIHVVWFGPLDLQFYQYISIRYIIVYTRITVVCRIL